MVISDGALISSDTETPAGPFAAQVVGALTANRPFRQASSGFVGTPSDGLSQLDTYHRLRDAYRAGLSASAPYARTYASYVSGWQAYANTLQNNPERSGDGQLLFDRAQQPDGSFPRDSEVDGSVAPDLFGLTEIDETAYPLLMAWQAGGFAGQTAFYESHVKPAADYIVAHGPSTGAERWEEHPGYSPATIAAEIAGLVAASKLATAANDPARAQLYLATADDYQRNVKTWTVTTTGVCRPASRPLPMGWRRHAKHVLGPGAWGWYPSRPGRIRTSPRRPTVRTRRRRRSASWMARPPARPRH